MVYATASGPGGFVATTGIPRGKLVNGAGQFIATITKAGEFTKEIRIYDANGFLTAKVEEKFTVAEPPQDGPKTDPPCPKPTE